MSNGNLKIPYGVSDFKRLWREGFYFVDKSADITAFLDLPAAWTPAITVKGGSSGFYSVHVTK